MSALLHLHDVSFRQSGHRLLDGIHFAVSRGQIIGLLGVNGAGKSTTLKVAAGLLSPTHGQVTLSANKLGYVPERPPLIPNWTVKGFLKHACDLHRLPKPQHNAAIERVITQCQLSTVTDKSCATLSKGNQQRVALAQAILHQPDILLLDEPTSGLDPQQIHAFRQLLQQLKPTTGIVFSSHIMQEVTTLCDTAIVIHAGQQISTMDIAKYTQRLAITFAIPQPATVFTDCPAWVAGDGTQHQFDVSKQTTHNDILTFCLDRGLPIRRVANATDLLEDTLLAHIGQATN